MGFEEQWFDSTRSAVVAVDNLFLRSNCIVSSCLSLATNVKPALNSSCFTEHGWVSQYKIFWFQHYCSIALSRIMLQDENIFLSTVGWKVNVTRSLNGLCFEGIIRWTMVWRKMRWTMVWRNNKMDYCLKENEWNYDKSISDVDWWCHDGTWN